MQWITNLLNKRKHAKRLKIVKGLKPLHAGNLLSLEPGTEVYIKKTNTTIDWIGKSMGLSNCEFGPGEIIQWSVYRRVGNSISVEDKKGTRAIIGELGSKFVKFNQLIDPGGFMRDEVVMRCYYRPV